MDISNKTVNRSQSKGTLREARGCSGPKRLQWKAARSSSGSMWFPEETGSLPIRPHHSEQAKMHQKLTSVLTMVLLTVVRVFYQAGQQRWVGAGFWGPAGEQPQTAGTGEWSDSCRSRKAWAHGSWNRPGHCIEQTLSPVQSGPEIQSLCTEIAPPGGGPLRSEPPAVGKENRL